MWDLDDKEYGIVIPVYECEPDERLIERAWAWTTAGFPTQLHPHNKSDLRVVRRKYKK